MMEILLVPIVGGIIGYFTNWLAIKMLFFPRRQYMLFGRRVPFTPGVLPKSKGRVANNLGNAVGDYLLTDDTLKETIAAAKLDRELFAMLDGAYERLKDNDDTLSSFLEKNMGNDYIPMTEAIQESLKGPFLGFLKDQGNREKLSRLVSNEIIRTLSSVSGKDVSLKLIDRIDSHIDQKGIPLLDRDSLTGLIESFLSGIETGMANHTGDIRSFISDAQLGQIKKAATGIVPVVFDYGAGFLKDNEALDNKLEGVIKKIAEDSVGQFIGSLVYKKVYASIKSNLLEFLENEDSRITAAGLVCSKIDEFTLKNPQEIMEMLHISDELKATASHKVISYVHDNYRLIARHTAEFVAGKIADRPDFSLYEAVEQISAGLDEKIAGETEKYMNLLLDKYAPAAFEAIYKLAAGHISRIQLSRLAAGVGERFYKSLRGALEKNKDAIIEKATSAIVDKIDIKQTVEDKINSLDAKDMEDIVLQVARKELNYITYMGGLLGFILGFLPEILSRIFP